MSLLTKKLLNKNLFFIFLLLFSSGSIVAQNVIEGQIMDELTGDPLMFANVVIEGTTEGAQTDFDGNFTISTSKDFPITVTVAYVGYKDASLVYDAPGRQVLRMAENVEVIGEVVIKGLKISDKEKKQPLTVESMSAKDIQEVASSDYYNSLENMKGVDGTSASIGVKVINTRGFNSTSPVRSLQIIDGVDNQAPGLNFSLGNFLGSSELDVLNVDIIAGASSAYYGPNAFNGVISIKTQNPFASKGMGVSLKYGERRMFNGALRWANSAVNADGKEWFAYKLNFAYLRADDWVADNLNPVYETEYDQNNPGGYDAVNRYGDEYFLGGDFTGVTGWSDFEGLGSIHRRGYDEIDLVDYDTKNVKANVALHFRTKPDLDFLSPEFIVSSSFGNGTTVYQGDNRFSLKNILFFQNRLEYRKRDKFFIRAYATHEDAGDSYDPYATALALNEKGRANGEYATAYSLRWNNEGYHQQMVDMGFPVLDLSDPLNPQFDGDAADAWYANPTNQEALNGWHNEIRNYVELDLAEDIVDNRQTFLEPGTDAFDAAFADITSRINSEEDENGIKGTRFYDKSALYHVHGEYTITPDPEKIAFIDKWVVGANGRLYTPQTNGTIFSDKIDAITNWEVGAYTGIEENFWDDKMKVTATVRMDKNQNFNLIATPAASLVWQTRPGDFLRLSFSAALRNPTLSDQYLNLDVGRAILAGNLEGVTNLVNIDTFLVARETDPFDYSKMVSGYFDIDPIQPERVKTFEVGYRTTLFKADEGEFKGFQGIYVDAGYYYSIYNDFLGYNIGLDVPLVGEIFIEDSLVSAQPDLPRVQAYRYAANSKEQVTTQGFSIGLNAYLNKFLGASANYSWNKLITQVDDPIVPAFNTPEHKFNIGLSGRDIQLVLGGFALRNWGFSVNYKWVEGFLFEGSPQFTGLIPTYDLLDAQVNFKMPKLPDMVVKIGATNVLNNKQFQTYGGPEIGRLGYVSVLYNWKKK